MGMGSWDGGVVLLCDGTVNKNEARFLFRGGEREVGRGSLSLESTLRPVHQVLPLLLKMIRACVQLLPFFPLLL